MMDAVAIYTTLFWGTHKSFVLWVNMMSTSAIQIKNTMSVKLQKMSMTQTIFCHFSNSNEVSRVTLISLKTPTARHDFIVYFHFGYFTTYSFDFRSETSNVRKMCHRAQQINVTDPLNATAGQSTGKAYTKDQWSIMKLSSTEALLASC